MAIKLHCISAKPRSSVLILVLVRMLLRINVQPAVAENADNSGDFGSYLEVYPPVNLSQSQLTCTPRPADNKMCPLYIALMMSFGREYVSSGVIASVQYALDQINADEDLLPGYSLHYTLTDSQCNRTVSLEAFHTQIINPPTKIAAIGSGCSIATEASAEVSHFYNITQLSCVSSSTALANRVRYPNYFQLLAPDADLADGFLAIIKQFEWERVALIVQEENLLTVTMDRLKQALDANGIKHSEKRFETEKGVESLGENPFDPEARIFIVATYYFRAQHLMCKAYEHGIRYPQYTFLFYGWYDPNWWIGTAKEQEYLHTIYPDCTPEQRASVVRYSLAPLQAEFLVDQDESTVISSGINGTQFRAEYDRYLNMSQFNLAENIYSQQCYDATWALAYALNHTLTECERGEGTEDCSAGLMTSERFGLQHFLYNNSQVRQKVKGHLEETNFTGITGRITFDRSDGVRRVGRTVVLSYQPCDERATENCTINITRVGTTRRIDNGTVMFSFTNGEDIWGSAGVPYDGVPNSHLITAHFPLAMFYIAMGAVGITFAVACLCFNFAFRKNPLIRLTSPNLNYLIGIGAIILYIDISLSVVPTTNHKTVTILCNVSSIDAEYSLAPWFNAIGYSLCFGTIVVKMFRVYYIFSNPTPTKKTPIHDWMLALIVLSLVGIDILILGIFMAIEGAKGRLGAVTVQDRENPMSIEGDLQIVNIFHIVVCKSKSRDIALGVLYGYKALLQIVAILFAFSTRKVKVKGLDDAKYIAIAVYVTSIVTAVIIVATYTLYDFSNILSIVLCTGIFVGATIILLLVFIPKMIALYKDPEGTSMFTKQQPPSSSHSQPHNRSSYSMSVQKQLRSTNDNSTTNEVESLKKRIYELESRLASVNSKEVEYNDTTHGSVDHENINME